MAFEDEFSFSTFSSVVIFLRLRNFFKGGSYLLGFDITAADSTPFEASLVLSYVLITKSSTVYILTVSTLCAVGASFCFSNRGGSGGLSLLSSTLGFSAMTLGASLSEIELPMIWNNIKIIIT
jgi:hypothetical protein